MRYLIPGVFGLLVAFLIALVVGVVAPHARANTFAVIFTLWLIVLWRLGALVDRRRQDAQS